jgi:hypothetical protein
VKQDKISETRSNTIFCVALSTSVFVTAFSTVTLARHPAFTTLLSVGKWLLPHVSTSVSFAFARLRVNTKAKSDALEHIVVTAAVLTLTVVLAGTMVSPG